MGGRAGEEILLEGDFTSGSSQDYAGARALATPDGDPLRHGSHGRRPRRLVGRRRAGHRGSGRGRTTCSRTRCWPPEPSSSRRSRCSRRSPPSWSMRRRSTASGSRSCVRAFEPVGAASDAASGRRAGRRPTASAEAATDHERRRVAEHRRWARRPTSRSGWPRPPLRAGSSRASFCSTERICERTVLIDTKDVAAIVVADCPSTSAPSTSRSRTRELDRTVRGDAAWAMRCSRSSRRSCVPLERTVDGAGRRRPAPPPGPRAANGSDLHTTPTAPSSRLAAVSRRSCQPVSTTTAMPNAVNGSMRSRPLNFDAPEVEVEQHDLGRLLSASSRTATGDVRVHRVRLEPLSEEGPYDAVGQQEVIIDHENRDRPSVVVIRLGRLGFGRGGRLRRVGHLAVPSRIDQLCQLFGAFRPGL